MDITALDQGIISTFKTYYVKQTFRYILDKVTNDNKLTVVAAWKQFSIYDYIEHAELALRNLKQSTLNGCWRPLWPECVINENPVPLNTVEYSNIIDLAYEVGGEGFDDLASGDIEELLSDKALSNDEIIDFAIQTPDLQEISEDDAEVTTLNANQIKEGLDLLTKVIDHFCNLDAIEKRACKFKCDLNLAMRNYRELYKDLTKNSKQQLITDFWTRTTTNSILYEHRNPNEGQIN